MSRKEQDDAPEDTDDQSEGEAAVVPEAGEGPFPPVAGEPRPPIGN